MDREWNAPLFWTLALSAALAGCLAWYVTTYAPLDPLLRTLSSALAFLTVVVSPLAVYHWTQTGHPPGLILAVSVLLVSGGTTAVLRANGAHDRSPVELWQATIRAKSTSRYRSGPVHHLLEVSLDDRPSWHVRFGVQRKVWSVIPPGEKVLVPVRAGTLGIPWLSRAQVPRLPEAYESLE